MGRVWTLLLTDDAGGWVMGVFSSKELGMAALGHHVQEAIANEHGNYFEGWAEGGKERYLLTDTELDHCHCGEACSPVFLEPLWITERAGMLDRTSGS